MDDTGTTRIGKYVFNHAFFIPGVLAIVFSASGISCGEYVLILLLLPGIGACYFVINILVQHLLYDSNHTT